MKNVAFQQENVSTHAKSTHILAKIYLYLMEDESRIKPSEGVIESLRL